VPPRRRFEARDLLRQVLLTQPEVSPDGGTVAYVRRTIEGGEYRYRIWSVPWRGGRARRLTGGDMDVRPRVSPDGERLLFLSNRSGSTQPWVLPLGGGEPEQLAELGGNVTAAEWSPDGRRVVLLAPSGEQRFVVGDPASPVARVIRDLNWRLDGLGPRDQFTSAWVVDGGRPRRVTAPDYEVFAAAWHPDGDRLAVVADRTSTVGVWEHPQVWIVTVDGGRPRLAGRLRQEIVTAEWSPDGALAVIGSDAESDLGGENYTLHLAGRRMRRLAPELDRTLFNATTGDIVDLGARFPPPLAWLDGETLVALVGDHGRTLPYRFGVDGSAAALAEGELVCYGLAAGGGRVAVAACVDGEAGEIYAVEESGLRQLTRDGSRWFRPYVRPPERVQAKVRGGPAVEGFLWRARGRPRGLVLHVHGGPNLAHGPAPWMEMVALADAGFHVIAPNPRGSVGYGDEFGTALRGRWGELDQADFLRLVDWAIAEGLTQRSRVGIVGLSYGGFTVTYLLGRHPGRFAAGVAENPVTDYLAEYGASDGGVDLGRVAAGTEPWDDGERMRAASPAAQIHRNEAPLLLLQCEGDVRCPPVNSEIVFAILRALGRPVELVRYPDESHLLFALGRPDRRVDRMERTVDWFRRYL
jgi:dipeptidyl aminopeptidase/acylaminoacyl peptidase